MIKMIILILCTINKFINNAHKHTNIDNISSPILLPLPRPVEVLFEPVGELLELVEELLEPVGELPEPVGELPEPVELDALEVQFRNLATKHL